MSGRVSPMKSSSIMQSVLWSMLLVMMGIGPFGRCRGIIMFGMGRWIMRRVGVC